MTRSGVRRRPQAPIHFFTMGEVANSLSLSTRTVRRWIDAGDLIAHRLGTIVRIAEPDLRAFLAVHRAGY
jgi:excisionase family DNA binding protein